MVLQVFRDFQVLNGAIFAYMGQCPIIPFVSLYSILLCYKIIGEVGLNMSIKNQTVLAYPSALPSSLCISDLGTSRLEQT